MMETQTATYFIVWSRHHMTTRPNVGSEEHHDTVADTNDRTNLLCRRLFFQTFVTINYGFSNMWLGICAKAETLPPRASVKYYLEDFPEKQVTWKMCKGWDTALMGSSCIFGAKTMLDYTLHGLSDNPTFASIRLCVNVNVTTIARWCRKKKRWIILWQCRYNPKPSILMHHVQGPRRDHRRIVSFAMIRWHG